MKKPSVSKRRKPSPLAELMALIDYHAFQQERHIRSIRAKRAAQDRKVKR